jgi:hypothetical protein
VTGQRVWAFDWRLTAPFSLHDPGLPDDASYRVAPKALAGTTV